jgi:predicted small secreted protein
MTGFQKWKLILRFSGPYQPANWSVMRYLIVVALVLSLNSCNTFIGLGRDIEQGFNWTQGKVQQSGNRNGGGGGDVAPVY